MSHHDRESIGAIGQAGRNPQNTNAGYIQGQGHSSHSFQVGEQSGNATSAENVTPAGASDNVDLSPTASRPAREYRNHGQMVSAAAHQGIHGQDLARIARGDTSLEDFLKEREERGETPPPPPAPKAPEPIQALAATEVGVPRPVANARPVEQVEVTGQTAPTPPINSGTPLVNPNLTSFNPVMQLLAQQGRQQDAVITKFFQQTSGYFNQLGVR